MDAGRAQTLLLAVGRREPGAASRSAAVCDAALTAGQRSLGRRQAYVGRQGHGRRLPLAPPAAAGQTRPQAGLGEGRAVGGAWGPPPARLSPPAHGWRCLCRPRSSPPCPRLTPPRPALPCTSPTSGRFVAAAAATAVTATTAAGRGGGPGRLPAAGAHGSRASRDPAGTRMFPCAPAIVWHQASTGCCHRYD